MSAKDVWRDLKKLSRDLVPPAAVLRTYAEALTQSTEGLLQGGVDVSTPHQSSDTVMVRFFVTVPALNGYEVALLSVEHGIHLYPAAVDSHWSDMGTLQAKNNVELEHAVEAHLSNPGIQKIVASLMSQAAA